MRHTLYACTLLLFALALCAPAQPPVLSYAFDEGGVGPTVNPGTGGTPMMALNGLDMSSTSLNGTPCLSNGTSAISLGADSGWVSDWTNGLTIAFCWNTQVAGPGNFAYILGDDGLSGFRCFTGGTGTLFFAGNGVNHNLMGSPTGDWIHAVFQYDPALAVTNVWLDGILQSTQPATPTGLVSSSTFKVGGNGTSTDGLDSGQLLEDFNVFPRVLSATEISGLVAACFPSIYSTNGPAASFTLDGTIGSPTQLAVVTKSAGQTLAVAAASTQIGLPWELAVTPVLQSVPVNGGGLDLGGGQFLNLNLGALGIFFLNGGTLSVPFPGGFNVSLPFPTGSYAVQSAHIDPAQPGGVALSQPTDFSFVACSPNSDFEGLPTGLGNAPVQWVNPSSNNRAWSVQSGGTSSVGTGPTSAFSGSNYFYCETSISPHPATFSFETCAFDTTALSAFTLNFALSRIGAAMGTLTIEYDDGATGTWVPLPGGVYTGPDPTQMQNGTEWSQESLSFTPSATLGAFRFTLVTTTTFTSDCAIDAISVQ